MVMFSLNILCLNELFGLGEQFDRFSFFGFEDIWIFELEFDFKERFWSSDDNVMFEIEF